MSDPYQVLNLSPAADDDQPPLPCGTITIHKDGILAVDATGARTADIDLGNVAILPSIVNASQCDWAGAETWRVVKRLHAEDCRVE